MFLSIHSSCRMTVDSVGGRVRVQKHTVDVASSADASLQVTSRSGAESHSNRAATILTSSQKHSPKPNHLKELKIN